MGFRCRVAFTLFSVAAAAQAAVVQQPATSESAQVRNTESWNLAKATKLAISGFDPVAYFPEGGGAPKEGKKEITTTHRGVTYRFFSVANRDLFIANPQRYEPAYGGWCAWAMVDGEFAEVDPTSFILKDNRLFLYYDGFFADTRAKWLKGDHAAYATKADAAWKKISGESPRMAPHPLPPPPPTPAPSASQSTVSTSTPASAKDASANSLKSQLDSKRAEFESKAPPEQLKVYSEGIDAVAKSGVLGSALKVGQKAPDFMLKDEAGTPHSLQDALKSGPVILTWFRGRWCPYCNIQLRAYDQSYAKFKAAGASLFAISPQTTENSLATSKDNALSFPVLSDPDNQVARTYGLAYTLPEAVSAAIKGRLDIAGFNGSSKEELPLAITYIVAKDGTIAYAYIDADYRTRAEPEQILKSLNDLAAKK